YLAKDPAPDYLIIGEPSAWDGITLGYKGYLKVSLRIDGERSHTAHEGPTIAARACSLWQEFEQAVAQWNCGRRRVFDQLLPALLDIRCDGDGRTASATLSIAIRLPVDLDGAQTLEWLHTVLGSDVSIESRDVPVPAWEGPRTGPLARTLGRTMLSRGVKPRYQVKTGTADLNILAPAWDCPAIAYGPGNAALDHRPDEHIVLEEYLQAIEILKDCLLELARTQTGVQVG
ncbi:MAG: LysW-gamma-L-lysine carboxypeptidase, partial [Planctomycetota bacterium]